MNYFVCIFMFMSSFFNDKIGKVIEKRFDKLVPMYSHVRDEWFFKDDVGIGEIGKTRVSYNVGIGLISVNVEYFNLKYLGDIDTLHNNVELCNTFIDLVEEGLGEHYRGNVGDGDVIFYHTYG